MNSPQMEIPRIEKIISCCENMKCMFLEDEFEDSILNPVEFYQLDVKNTLNHQ